jgi:hypothetical protein
MRTPVPVAALLAALAPPHTPPLYTHTHTHTHTQYTQHTHTHTYAYIQVRGHDVGIIDYTVHEARRS